MLLKEHKISITTDASGDSTDYPEQTVSGVLYAVSVSNGTLAATADLTLSFTDAAGINYTLLTLTNVSGDAIYYPRHQVHNNTGTGLTLEGTQINAAPPIVVGQVKCVTAQGGSAKSGAVLVYVIED